MEEYRLEMKKRPGGEREGKYPGGGTGRRGLGFRNIEKNDKKLRASAPVAELNLQRKT